ESTTIATLDLPRIGRVDVTVTQSGTGAPVLLLHGGGGPLTAAGFAGRLAADAEADARVITPTHPGFDGTPRPERLDDIRGLAAARGGPRLPPRPAPPLLRPAGRARPGRGPGGRHLPRRLDRRGEGRRRPAGGRGLRRRRRGRAGRAGRARRRRVRPHARR